MSNTNVSAAGAASARVNEPQFEYAYHFPEGTGYLFVRHLGGGVDGTADVVWSCAEASREQDLRASQANAHSQPITDNPTKTGTQGSDNNSDADQDLVEKFFVRKKTQANLPFRNAYNPNRAPVQVPEVSNFRQHPRIPRLIDWVEYHPLPVDHSHHLQVTAAAMIFQRCNGGTLRSILREYSIHRQQVQQLSGPRGSLVFIPESFIWKVFGQILEVANWLHHQRPGIYHGDIHLDNVFLHFSDDTSVLPDCFLGDFGRSQIMYSSSWDTSGIPTFAAADPHMDEYRSLLTMIQELMTLSESSAVPGGSDTVRQQYDGLSTNKIHYSQWLYAKIRWFENEILDSEEYRTNCDFSLASRQITDMANAMSGIAPESLRNNRMYDTEPKTFASARLLLLEPEDEQPAGPWKVAKIRSDTKEVVALSREVYRTHQPASISSLYLDQYRTESEHSMRGSDRDISVTEL